MPKSEKNTDLYADLPPHQVQSCCLAEMRNQDAFLARGQQLCGHTGLWTDFLSAISAGKLLYFEDPSERCSPAISCGQKKTRHCMQPTMYDGTNKHF